MPDESRRRRRTSSESSNDFDWDEFERSLNLGKSRRSRYSNDDTIEEEIVPEEEISRRRVQQNTNQKRKKRAVKENKRRVKKKNSKVLKRLRFCVLMICLVAVVVGTGITIGMYAAVSKEISAMNIQNLALNTSSFIYYTDEDGDAHELQKLQAETNRIWVESSKISQYAKDAIVAIEDERFYTHNGVDIKRTAGATMKYALAKIGIGEASYGGSTITQQVIKNITNETDKTSGRKVKEILRAIALEKELSKDEILTLYLNIVYFANNCNGIEAASNIYFNKHASELNLQEAASIAGITQYPSLYDPLNNPNNNVEKRNIVLGKMLELGMIEQAEYDKAVKSKLAIDKSYRRTQNQVTSYFSDQVVSDVINDLMEQKGYSEDFATQQVYNGGLKIYATVDIDIQEIMEDVFEDTSNFPSTGKGGQSAMVVTDPYTGAVKGIIGGLGKKEDIRGWNRASQMKRQPGSSIKPLSVYAPAVDKNAITAATIIKDEKITIGSDNWQPKNSYNKFYGDMTVIEAVARSSNIPAVKVLDEVGLTSSYNYLQNKFHFSSITEKDKNYSSLALGGLTEGVSPMEMSAAYGTFVNGGKYIKPYTYTQVIDSAGITILQNGANATQAISAATAYITADLLSGVVNSSYGTGRSAKLNSMPTYGKTGTTDDDFDKWFVGFTPYYVGAVWYGFDTPMSISKAGVRGNPCITAWKKVMEEIHSTLSSKELVKPKNVVEEKICLDTGKKAGGGCDSRSAYFIEGTQPKNKCNSQVEKSTVGESAESTPSSQENEDGMDSSENNRGSSSNSGTSSSSNESSSSQGSSSNSNAPSGGTASSGGTSSSNGASSSNTETSSGSGSSSNSGSSSGTGSSSVSSGTASESGSESSEETQTSSGGAISGSIEE